MNTYKTYKDFGTVRQYIKYCRLNNIYADLRDADLRDANLRNANLLYADLRGANLQYANLSDADLINADLRNANLIGADLRSTDLVGANLVGADLRNANLACANLYTANLCGADLCGANLRSTDLRGANLRDVKYDSTTAFYALACPEEGEFVAWKKVDGYIVKLKIPADAKRSSATTRKCRCSHAIVLDIQNLDGTSAGIDHLRHDAYSHITTYKILDTVIPDSFDDDRWNECSNGIHFFITRQEAVQY